MNHPFNQLPPRTRLASRYVIEQAIGRGRSSAVYRALDTVAGTPVAIKVLDPFLAQDPVGLERFRREAQIIRSLEHPAIIKVYEFVQEGPFHMIVMELFPGLDGKAWIEKHGAMPLNSFSKVARAIISSVSACHLKGILHRDLKPHNLLISENGDAKLVDFGISRVNTMSDLTKTGTALGTPEYMAPELYTYGRPDMRSDVYSLGVLLYELLVEKPPYRGKSVAELLKKQMSGEFEPLKEARKDVPPYLDALITKCLRTDPNRRYLTAGEVLADFERGDRAVCLVESRQVSVPCFACKTDLLPGLPFCHGCGKFSSETIGKGDTSVIIRSLEKRPPVLDFIRRTFPKLDLEKLDRRLKSPPVLLVTKVSEASAAALTNDLVPLGCEVEVVKKLPSQFRLPLTRTLPLLGILVVTIVACASVAPDAFLWILPVAGFVEFSVWQVYRRKSRPAIPIAPRTQGPSPAVVALAQAIKKLTQPDTKALLARVAERRIRVPDSVAKLLAVDLDRLLAQAAQMALDLEQCDNYLGATSLNRIQSQVERCEARAQAATTADQTEEALREKAGFARELTRYRATLDRHAALTTSLLQLHATFERLTDAHLAQSAIEETRGWISGFGSLREENENVVRPAA